MKIDWLIVKSFVIYCLVVHFITLDLQNISEWSQGERLTFILFGILVSLIIKIYYLMVKKYIIDNKLTWKAHIKYLIVTHILFIGLYQFISMDLQNIFDWHSRDRSSLVVAYIVVMIATYIYWDIRRTIVQNKIEKEKRNNGNY